MVKPDNDTVSCPYYHGRVHISLASCLTVLLVLLVPGVACAQQEEYLAAEGPVPSWPYVHLARQNGQLRASARSQFNPHWYDPQRICPWTSLDATGKPVMEERYVDRKVHETADL